ncbi:MAG: ABC transporter substrate-binding protein [Mariprofundaceae bacterium]|nr:ABC transporter substrate-binding protein [Mariprofundaceae bacterium]
MTDISVSCLARLKARRVLLGILIIFIASPLAMAADDGAKAVAVIERLHESLMVVMRHADTLAYNGRYRKLAAVVSSSFDLQRLARISTGKYWRGLNAQQKLAFTDVFSRLVIATYAHRFNGYSGEHFRIAGQRKLSRGGMLVRAYLVKNDGSQVSLNYILRPQQNRWRIINVLAEGVSDLALKRSEYTTILATEGVTRLILRLEGKIRSFE